GGGGSWRRGGGVGHEEDGRGLVESGEGSNSKRELEGSISVSQAAANGRVIGNSAKMEGLQRNRDGGAIADASTGLHADLQGDGGGMDVYGVDSVTGSGSGVGNGGKVASVFWQGELEYEEVAVWRRDRILGRWLRRLWMSHPSTRPAIQDCLIRHLHAPFWRTVLMAIVNQQARLFGAGGGGGASAAVAAAYSACGSGRWNGCAYADSNLSRSPQPPSEPTPLELIPLTGADAFVFLYGGTAIKIFVHEVPAMRGLMCALELRTPQLLLAQAHVSATETPAEAAVISQSPVEAVSVAAAGGDVGDPTMALVVTAPTGFPPLLPLLPQPLAWGTVAVALTRRRSLRGEEEEMQDREETERRAPGRQGQLQQLLYVVHQKVQGSCVLQELLDAELSPHYLIAVAEESGHLMGKLHAAAAGKAATAAATVPAAMTAAAAAPTSVEEWDEVVRERAVWHNRYQNIWVSGLGCVSAAPDDEDEGSDSGSGGGAGSGSGADAATSSSPRTFCADGGWRCDVPLTSPWWPFVQHLRSRKRRLLRNLPGLSLPAWVKDQLPAYLPEDPAELLGFGAAPELEASASASASASAVAAAPPPLLLHGDVTAHNVIVAHPPPPPPPPPPHTGDFTTADRSADVCDSWHPQLSLVDFSDSGHGDPLYELLPVLASCLRCDTKAAAAFWACYCRHVQPPHVWPKRLVPAPPGTNANGSIQNRLSLSYCAMCYCLLHEEAELLLQRVWQWHGPAASVSTSASTSASTSVAAAVTTTAVQEGSGSEGTAEVAALGLGKVGFLDDQELAGQKTLERLAVRLWGFLGE
ncbi:hypothetical protein VaNZ11_013028, partial [Volvox africanus]